MKKFIPVLALVFAFGVTMPAFAADPAPAPAAPTAEKKDDGKTKKDEKKEKKNHRVAH